MTKVAIIGAAGRMGQALIRCVLRSTNVRLVAAVEAPQCPLLGKDAGTVAGLPETGVRIVDDLRSVVSAADVLIDFSFHSAAPDNAAIAAEFKKPLVIGTTGLTPEEQAVIRRTAEKVPVVWAPNMSVGVNLLFSMVRKAAEALGTNYDVEIIETHHRMKKDSPSGTALRLGEKIAEGRGQDFKAVAVFGREGIGDERPTGQIGIHAVRGGDTVGEHTVIFATEGERIEFTHRASSRDALAMGALRAAVWVQARPPDLYDMQDVLGL